jgi:ribosomal protein S18 acetylase RimI-like enzyme
LAARVTMAAMVIRELAACDLAAAVGVVARAMRDNPMDVAALGDDADLRLRRLQRMFAIALPGMLRKGVILAAFDGQTLGAVAAMLPPGRCQPSAFEKLWLAPQLMPALGFRGFRRLGRWLGAWGRHDLHEPHWHLGPIGVDAHRQGRGFGRALLETCCAQIDRAGTAGYLETDKLQNVAFYTKHGFETVGESTILGTPNWFMRRPRKPG